MDLFLHSNDWKWRLARTIFGQAVMDPSARAFVVALVMAVLTPIMAELDSGSGGSD